MFSLALIGCFLCMVNYIHRELERETNRFNIMLNSLSQDSYFNIVFVLILHLSSPISSIENEILIYRNGYQGNFEDIFMMSKSLCNASTLSCHDYQAAQLACNKCSCVGDNDTFGYFKDWRCFKARELRQDTGCSVGVKNGLSANHLQSVSTGDSLQLNLSLSSQCTYQYSQDTYYRTCDGSWTAVGNLGSSRYELYVNVRADPGKPDRYTYWIQVETDQQASRFLQGRIMKINFKCKKSGTKPWDECFIFKEKYISKPVLCTRSIPTIVPSIKLATALSEQSATPIIKTAASTTFTEPMTTEITVSSVEMTTNTTTEMTTNTTYQHKQRKGLVIHKNVIIGVSAAGGLLFVALMITIWIKWWRRRQRRDISKYTAALYDSAQGQSSSGMYAETSIRLPNDAKSPTLMSPSNPSYERGHDFSIKIADSQKQQSNTTSSPRLVFTNESFEGDVHPSTPKVIRPHSPVKQRGSMLVKYENVTVLSDLRPESVPDAERFYDNPGADTPQYHVLENPTEEAPSYGEYTPRVNSDNSANNVSGSTDQNHGDNDDDNDISDDPADDFTYDFADEPIYTNSPAIVANEARENKFSFEARGDDLDDSVKEVFAYDINDCNSDIYVNSETVRNSLSDNQSTQNAGYVNDEENEDEDDMTHENEPIYDNASSMNNTNDLGGSPLLTSQSHQCIYQDLKSGQGQESDYQPLTPDAYRKTHKPKPKPRPRNQRQ